MDFSPLSSSDDVQQDVLHILATRFDKFLGNNNATLYQTRATGAQICVDMDLLKDRVEGFPLKIGNRLDIWQEVVYEKLILCCNHGFKQGHVAATCRVVTQIILCG